MGEQSAASYWIPVETCMSAIGGDVGALRTVRESRALTQRALELRLGPALALAAADAGAEGAAAWKTSLQASMTRWLLVDRAVSGVRETLEAADLRWVPIKGFDVGTRFYGEREGRETSDLDLLVDTEQFAAARRALEENGWVGWSRTSNAEDYLAQEGYAWQASRESLGLLEVHFRFWGVVPEGLEAAAMAAARPDMTIGATAARLAPEYCYLVAAVHAWTQPPPRSLNDWRDMEQVLRRSSDARWEDVVELSRRWSLELPVTLSALVADRLWPRREHGRVVAALLPELARRERQVVDRLEARGADGVAWSRIALARLMAGRPSRAGWRSVWRRLWPHSAKVEEATPDDWSWPRRRWHHLRASLGE